MSRPRRLHYHSVVSTSPCSPSLATCAFLRRTSQILPSLLIFLACSLCSSTITGITKFMLESFADYEGSMEFPALSMYYIRGVQAGTLQPVLVLTGLALAIALYLIGRRDRLQHLHGILCNLVWLGIVLFLTSTLFAVTLPFIKLIQYME